MGQNADDLDKFIFQFVAGADDVDHAVFFQIFGALKTVRKFFANGLFNNAGTGKTDNAALFGNVDIAEHGERTRRRWSDRSKSR